MKWLWVLFLRFALIVSTQHRIGIYTICLSKRRYLARESRWLAQRFVRFWPYHADSNYAVDTADSLAGTTKD